MRTLEHESTCECEKININKPNEPIVCNVAIMGLGTVGGGTYKILSERKDIIAHNDGVLVNVEKVLERSMERVDALGIARDKVCSSIDEIANDPNIHTVIEVMGGVEPAFSFMKKCLESGKNVVTANKECIAKKWAELEAASKVGKSTLLFEASCVGGVPVIRTLTESMQANSIQEIMGIFNGTTNFILSQMTNEGADYADVLAQAQNLGFAEADPTSDVEGFDSMYKLSILSSLAFHTSVPYSAITREGITKISAKDIDAARELDFVIKLLAVGKRVGNKIECRVQPTFVPIDHPLAAVGGSFNAMFIKGDNVGDVMLYGRGAGDLPTGSAIVSDLIYGAKLCKPKYSTFENTGVIASDIEIIDDYSSKFYFAVECPDVPGTLGQMTTILGAHGVSLDSCIQRARKKEKATIIFLTHMCSVKSLKNALSELESFCKVKSLIHVI